MTPVTRKPTNPPSEMIAIGLASATMRSIRARTVSLIGLPSDPLIRYVKALVRAPQCVEVVLGLV